MLALAFAFVRGLVDAVEGALPAHVIVVHFQGFLDLCVQGIVVAKAVVQVNM